MSFVADALKWRKPQTPSVSAGTIADQRTPRRCLLCSMPLHPEHAYVLLFTGHFCDESCAEEYSDLHKW